MNEKSLLVDKKDRCEHDDRGFEAVTIVSIAQSTRSVFGPIEISCTSEIYAGLLLLLFASCGTVVFLTCSICEIIVYAPRLTNDDIMADTENQNTTGSATSASASPAAQSPAKKEKKTKNPRTKPSHPPTSEMVNNAIKGLKERGGSSLQAIKKYIAANYKVDAEKVSPFIKKYLKASVASGALVQTKGKGASGSFKLASATSGSASKASSGEKKKVAKKGGASKKSAAATTSSSGEKAKSAKKAVSPKAKKVAAAAVEKKAAKAKKPSAEKKSGAAKPSAASAKPKSPSKAKKSNKGGPTKKPKAPKPKTAKSASGGGASSSPKRKAAASPKKRK